jgi:Na+:H+ antiporter, NhaA family
MPNSFRPLSATFNRFFESEKSGGVLLLVCTVFSLAITNSSVGYAYLGLWETKIGGMSVSHLINDGLMAIFFLLIGLELERELYVGELSNLKSALLPIFAALGGMLAPALIHFAFNGGTPTQAGFGIPMATDIAFAVGVLALLGKHIPASLKIFVVAFAVIDDLGAIIVIATFYTAELSIAHLAAALAIWAALIVLNRVFHVMALTPYLLAGTLMWFLMLKSGIHATITGVMLAFAIPFSARVDSTGDSDFKSPSHRLEHFLHKPVAFIILPIFALANTGILLGDDWLQGLRIANSVGIVMGLVIGKPLGVTLLCLVAVMAGVCKLPHDITWRHIFGAGVLGGIGFTMSIFITNLAFEDNAKIINASKMAILLASTMAGIAGFLWLKFLGKPDTNTSPF